jgi:hypothetical protein
MAAHPTRPSLSRSLGASRAVSSRLYWLKAWRRRNPRRKRIAWEITLIRERGQFLGYVEAPDTAIGEAACAGWMPYLNPASRPAHSITAAKPLEAPVMHGKLQEYRIIPTLFFARTGTHTGTRIPPASIVALLQCVARLAHPLRARTRRDGRAPWAPACRAGLLRLPTYRPETFKPARPGRTHAPRILRQN